ncbi:hypothetical protein ACVWY0_001266 [Arthrobacter sp. UYNi723]
MSTFTAKYAAGTCADCETRIKPGEEISRNLDQDYIHVDCPDTELDRLVNKPVCPSCWLIGPCDCN